MRFDMFIIFYYVNATVFILSTFQNYIAPLRKVLDSNPANCVGKKAEEMEQVICKYGMYCQTLLRYCIEALSKAKKPAKSGRNVLNVLIWVGKTKYLYIVNIIIIILYIVYMP